MIWKKARVSINSSLFIYLGIFNISKHLPVNVSGLLNRQSPYHTTSLTPAISCPLDPNIHLLGFLSLVSLGLSL